MRPGPRIKDLPPSERPRERLRLRGPADLKTSELVAILLRTGTKGLSALQAAEQLLSQFQKLEHLARAPLEQIASVPGIGPDKAVTLKAAFSLGERIARELQAEAPLVHNPGIVARLLREECRQYETEHFHVLLLNTRRRLIRIERLGSGTLDAVHVHPRDVFRAAILANAAAVILAHNHPSGDPSPSDPDIRVTRDLIRAGQLLRIEVLDHVILGRPTNARPEDFVSLRELGYFHP